VIDAALPKTPAVKAHFRALPYQDVPDTLEKIEASNASLSSRLCFQFLVLTAARSGEARGARWDEIDLDARTWTIPESRMKAGREHRVPLSDAALEGLRRAKALDDNSGLVFPSLYKPGRELSDMTLTKLLRDNGLAETATVHGFRTSFKTWC
jgi:integrase